MAWVAQHLLNWGAFPCIVVLLFSPAFVSELNMPRSGAVGLSVDSSKNGGFPKSDSPGGGKNVINFNLSVLLGSEAKPDIYRAS